ncbi:MAG: UbiX family flavin prenyltransferase [Proteobacteria bacterium]|nr:UbiX family flavin prenyltransferase [Pseudomonadota bacterium]
MKQEVTLAFSGASGAAYGIRLLELLVHAKVEVSLVFSTAGLMVISDETDIKLPANPQKIAQFFTTRFASSPDQIKVYSKDNWYSPLASGSGAPKTMIVCPCSTGCLSAIALGASDNLLERAADVVLKEQGKLILVIREMPLSAIHIEHMLSLARLGVCIMPASPGFYFNPQSKEDLIDFVVARILDQIGVAHNLSHKWGKE